MKAAVTSRYAVFLILLVLGQEFCVALRVAPQGESLTKREIKKNGVEGRSRQKRTFTIVLLAVTLAVSAAGVGFEIYGKVKGCCGTFPDACRYAREIDAFRKTVSNKTAEVDKVYLKAKNLKEDVIQANYHINEMWIDLLAIGRSQELVIKTLSPGTVKKFHDKWAEIEKQLKNGNLTVQRWTYTQIDLIFKSYFDNPSTVLGGTSKFISNTISTVYAISEQYYRVNALNKMINQLSTGQSYRQLVTARHTKAAKTIGLNDAGLNKFIKETAVSRFNSKFASKYAFFFNAYNVVGSLISIGFDVWRVIGKIKACKDKRDKVKDLWRKWSAADKEMDNIKIYATNYYNLLKNEGWKYVKGNLTDANLIKTLKSLKTMAKAVKPQTTDLKKSGAYIEKYITHISASVNDYTKTYHLQEDLIKGLMTVKLLLQCNTARTRFLYYVSEECKRGLNSLADIYASRRTTFLVKDADCVTAVGVPDAVQLQEMENMIAARAKKEKYQKDCILNNPHKKSDACWFKKKNKSDNEIANKLKLNLAQVQYFTTNCPKTLTPAERYKICFSKMILKLSVGLIKAYFFPKLKESVINAVTCG